MSHLCPVQNIVSHGLSMRASAGVKAARAPLHLPKLPLSKLVERFDLALFGVASMSAAAAILALALVALGGA